VVGDEREPTAPPCDALAEMLVLQKLWVDPPLIDTVELADLFVKPQHARLWHTFARARAAQRETGAAFVALVLDDLKQRQPDDYWILLDPVLDWHLEAQRAWEEVELYPHHEPGRLMFSEYFHDFDWWLARLVRIREARDIISAASEVAERAWEVPEREFSFDAAARVFRRARVALPPTALEKFEDVLDI